MISKNGRLHIVFPECALSISSLKIPQYMHTGYYNQPTCWHPAPFWAAFLLSFVPVGTLHLFFSHPAVCLPLQSQPAGTRVCCRREGTESSLWMPVGLTQVELGWGWNSWAVTLLFETTSNAEKSEANVFVTHLWLSHLLSLDAG